MLWSNSLCTRMNFRSKVTVSLVTAGISYWSLLGIGGPRGAPVWEPVSMLVRVLKLRRS